MTSAELKDKIEQATRLLGDYPVSCVERIKIIEYIGNLRIKHSLQSQKEIKQKGAQRAKSI